MSFESILGAAIFDRFYRPESPRPPRPPRPAQAAQAAEVKEVCLAEAIEAFVLLTADDIAGAS